MEISTSAKIEGLLFWKGEPMTLKEISNALNLNIDDVKKGISDLKNVLQNRGLTIIEKDDSVLLGTNKDLSEILEKLRKEELEKDLSKASLETISIILYKDDVTRSDIDYIRGVNSSFILRNLLVRGLVEKITDPKDNRRYIYRPTFELLSFLGISKREEAPDFGEVSNRLKGVLETNIEKESENEIQIIE